MSSLFNRLSEELFQILKGSGKTLTLYGEDGNKTYEPKNARRVFAVPGNMMISVIEAGSDSEVKLYLSQSTDVDEVSTLINTLRQISTRYNVLFNVRKYARELQPKDFAYQASVMEASMYGSTRTSYQKFGPTKLIVRHCTPVREGVIGSRGRNILSMFVETNDGERFKFPANHLSGGRAFAQHINQGGKPHDVVGTQISELALEALQLAKTARFIHHNRNQLGEAACAVRPVIKNRVVEIRRAFGGLSRPRGYHRVTESGLPVLTKNLMESQGLENEIQRLGELLQIDSNHALAESLMPVALLTLGEQMTNTNNSFQSVIALDENAAAALVEALSSEYGHDAANWKSFGSNVAFYDSAVFEDACSTLDIMEANYQVDEAGSPYDPEHGWDMDHQYWSDRPEEREAKMLEFAIDEFDYNRFIDDYYNQVTDGEEKDVPLDSNLMKKEILGTLKHTMEHSHDYNIDEIYLKDGVNQIYKTLRADIEAKGYHFSDTIEEFAQFEDKPEHHGIAAGDYVSTDMGSAVVISIEGEIAAVEFLNGRTTEMHVDDMDKVPTLGHVAEEVELDEWFQSFDPSSVLTVAEDEVEEAREPVYHSVFSMNDDGTWGHHFDADDAIDAKEEERFIKANGGKAVTIKTPHTKANWGTNPDQVNPDDYVQQHLGAKAAKKAPVAQTPVDEAFGKKSPTFKAWISLHGEDDCEVEVEYYHDDNHPIIDTITVAGSGEEVSFDNLTGQDQDYLANSANEDAAERHEMELDHKADMDRNARDAGDFDDDRYDESEELDELSPARVSNYFDRSATSRGHLERLAVDGDEEAARKLAKREQGLGRAFVKMREEDEEVIGGDKGEDLIDDTKVDEAFQNELNDLLKNARFRF